MVKQAIVVRKPFLPDRPEKLAGLSPAVLLASNYVFTLANAMSLYKSLEKLIVHD